MKKRPPESPNPEPKADSDRLSRRSFLKGGAATVAAGTGLSGAAKASTTDAEVSLLHGPGAVAIELMVNGRRLEVSVEPRVTLLDALRDHLDVTGPKKVCDRATCGACTVLLDGELIYSCSRLAIDSQGAEITTVEGLGSPESEATMHAVQKAFVEHDAQQCGFCTPGFVLAVNQLVETTPNPSEEQIRHALGGNLCRCGTYGGIRKVVVALAGEEA